MKTVKIEFTKEQVQVLNAAIVELPFRIAEPLIRHINSEIQKNFDDAVGDSPSGATTEPDRFAGD